MDSMKRYLQDSAKPPFSTLPRGQGRRCKRGFYRLLLFGRGLGALASVLFFVAFVTFVQRARADEILVAAAASLTDVLKEIGASYQAKGTHKVSFTFGA